MFDVSFWELLIIGVIALIVVGPERLPGLARTLGLWVGRARATFTSLKDEIERESHIQGLKDTERAMREREREFREDVQRTTRDVHETAESARSDVEEAAGERRNGGGDADAAAEKTSPQGERERDNTGQ
ncbi:Sec-independent protein translocase protein TatB [Arhodomonas sp. SL1]|uniref:Sec-independent protein translocase protein TatB n=1 Tax=Arhodomonas sp. SL1 TaxID=3425691 RepID=UPI003F882B46